VGTVTVNGHIGRNRLGLTRILLHGRRLSPGRYTLFITVTNRGTGKQTQPRRLSFTVVR
jgi:hypothetical protein